MKLAPLALAAMLVAGAAQAVQFTVEDLGPGAGRGINASGQAAIGALWYQPNQSGLLRSAVNDAGVFVGHDDNANGGRDAVRISGRKTTVLPSFYDDKPGSQALGINASGWVVGVTSGQDDQSPTRAVLWSPAGEPLNLGALAGDLFSEGHGINSAGAVVGRSSADPDGIVNRAFVWTSARGMVALPSLPGSGNSGARAINDAGTIVGYSGDRAVLWRGGVVQDLGIGSSQTFAWALAINALDQVVGGQGMGAGAFLWSARSGPRDLGAMLAPGSAWQLAEAGGINSLGQIAATSKDKHALRLTPGGSLAWVGQGRSLSFNDAAQWEMGFAPRAVFDAVIDPKATLTVTLGADATVNSLSLGSSSGAGPTLQLLGGATLTAAQGVQVHASARLAGSGQIAGALLNSGSVSVTQIGISGGLENHGVISGHGRLAAVLNNTSEGLLQVGSGQSLGISADGTHLNAGFVAVSAGGELRYEGRVDNQASGRLQIDKGSVSFADGLSNGGVLVTTAGGAAVQGDVHNLKAGLVLATGGSGLSFDGAFDNGAVVRAEQGSRIVFRGAVKGGGSFETDATGMLRFEGGLAASDLTLGNSELASTLTMDWGTTAHDHIVFSGSLLLDSGAALALQFGGGLQAQAGQRFDLFDFGATPQGRFDALWLPTLDAGLAWDSSALYRSGELRITAVPEPATLTLWLLGLTAAGLRVRSGRRRR